MCTDVTGAGNLPYGSSPVPPQPQYAQPPQQYAQPPQQYAPHAAGAHPQAGTEASGKPPKGTKPCLKLRRKLHVSYRYVCTCLHQDHIGIRTCILTDKYDRYSLSLPICILHVCTSFELNMPAVYLFNSQLSLCIAKLHVHVDKILQNWIPSVLIC